MRRLTRGERVLILKCFTEGMGVNASARMADVSKHTVLKLLADLGPVCREYQRRTLVGLACKTIQAYEIWGFCGMQKNVPDETVDVWGIGDVWSWVSICTECHLVLTWLVGPRDGLAACAFMCDLARRLKDRIQLTTDGHAAYPQAVWEGFADEIDYAELVTLFDLPAAESPQERGYSPGKWRGTRIDVMSGNPDPRKIATAYSERLNLELRTKNRRLTGLTRGFRRKVQNLQHSLDIGFMVYNFVKVHSSGVSPAIQTGVTDRLWSYEDVVTLLEEVEPSAVEVGSRRKDRRISTEP